MLERNALLDLSILGLHPSVILVAVRVKLGQCAQALLAAVVIDEPTW